MKDMANWLQPLLGEIPVYFLTPKSLLHIYEINLHRKPLERVQYLPLLIEHYSTLGISR
jgi:hypothetical protein